jgi:hypothetical protein
MTLRRGGAIIPCVAGILFLLAGGRDLAMPGVMTIAGRAHSGPDVALEFLAGLMMVGGGLLATRSKTRA